MTACCEGCPGRTPEETTMTHITHIEFDGRGYYWWCQDTDCLASSTRHFAYEADCAADGGQHEREANG